MIFLAGRFTLVVQNLINIREIAAVHPGQLKSPAKEICIATLKQALRECDALGLTLSSMYITEFLEDLKEPMQHDVVEGRIRVATDRMNDELSLATFIQIANTKADYYYNDEIFGQAVMNRFPKAIEDIQEAAKCFALGRSTACVFHLMRAMELATQYLGKRLGLSFVTEKNWANILDQVDKAIKALPVKNSRQKAKRNRLSEASAHLRMVKDAWRNDVMHPKETYTEEEAERVFRNVKDFMVHLATKL